jgi:hypothetical protein
MSRMKQAVSEHVPPKFLLTCWISWHYTPEYRSHGCQNFKYVFPVPNLASAAWSGTRFISKYSISTSLSSSLIAVFQRNKLSFLPKVLSSGLEE